MSPTSRALVYFGLRLCLPAAPVLRIVRTRNSAHSRFVGSSRTSDATCLCVQLRTIESYAPARRARNSRAGFQEMAGGFVAHAHVSSWPAAVDLCTAVLRLLTGVNRPCRSCPRMALFDPYATLARSCDRGSIVQILGLTSGLQKSGISACGVSTTHDEPDPRVFSAQTASGHLPSAWR
jgi:hypothetical protein